MKVLIKDNYAYFPSPFGWIVCEAEETLTHDVYYKTEKYDEVWADYSLEEYIDHFNSLKPYPSTGLPVKWEDETEDRKNYLMKVRPTRKLVSYKERKVKVVLPPKPLGHMLKSKTGGNMNKGFWKLISKENIITSL